MVSSETWNFTVEERIRPGWTASVAYAGQGQALVYDGQGCQHPGWLATERAVRRLPTRLNHVGYIGFEVPWDQLAAAFFETYGFPSHDVLGHPRNPSTSIVSAPTPARISDRQIRLFKMREHREGA